MPVIYDVNYDINPEEDALEITPDGEEEEGKVDGLLSEIESDLSSFGAKKKGTQIHVPTTKIFSLITHLKEKRGFSIASWINLQQLEIRQGNASYGDHDEID